MVIAYDYRKNIYIKLFLLFTFPKPPRPITYKKSNAFLFRSTKSLRKHNYFIL